MSATPARIFFACVLTVLTVLTGCATTAGRNLAATGDSLLIIGATLHRMDPDGHIYAENFVLDSLSVKNIKTGQVYNIGLTNNHSITSLPSGYYCLNTISPYSNVTLNYCGKPVFKLDAGRVMNAGYFVFGIDYPHQRFKLARAFSDAQGLYSSLTGMERALVHRFIREHTACARASSSSDSPSAARKAACARK